MLSVFRCHRAFPLLALGQFKHCAGESATEMRGDFVVGLSDIVSMVKKMIAVRRSHMKGYLLSIERLLSLHCDLLGVSMSVTAKENMRKRYAGWFSVSILMDLEVSGDVSIGYHDAIMKGCLIDVVKLRN